MTDNQKLLAAFLDNRDGLDEIQLAALADALRGDSQLAVALKEQLLVDELLAQQLAVDRADFLAQVRQRVSDFERGERELSRHVDEMRVLAADEFRRRRHPRSWQRWAFAGLAASLLVAAPLLYIFFQQKDTWGNLHAVIFDVEGAGLLVRDGASRRAERDVEVRAGDRFVTSAEQALSVRYTDGTWVQIDAETSAEFRDDDRTHGKQVLIEQGGLAASIAPQDESRPMTFSTPDAEARVLGTEIWLARIAGGSQLEVLTGSVEFIRTSDGRSQMVRAGEAGFAGSDRFEVRSAGWPSQREALAFLHQSPTASNLVRKPAGGLRRCHLTPRGAAEWNADGDLQLAGGSAVARGAEEDLLAVCRERNELSLEIVFTPAIKAASPVITAPGWIVSFASAPGEANFVLAQDGDRLRFGLADEQHPIGEPLSFVELAAAQPGTTMHLVVTYRPGELMAYLDGRQVLRDLSFQGTLAKWELHPLVVGDALAGGQAWHGQIAALAVYGRAMSADEAAANVKAYNQLRVTEPDDSTP